MYKKNTEDHLFKIKLPCEIDNLNLINFESSKKDDGLTPYSYVLFDALYNNYFQSPLY